MVNTHYEDFIKKLLEDTKGNLLEWHYLDANQTLVDGMKLIPSSDVTAFSYAISSSNLVKSKTYFDIDNSYYTSIGTNTFVVLLRPYSSDLSKLYVVPNGFRKIMILSSKDYGDLIKRLSNLIETQFPSAEQAINNYLDNN